ncbi:hypothetical protein NX04_21590 [Xanthomonas vasicola]|nr:hypothetical protein NX04_21590 [Xanthomonas vasicola]
MDMLPAKQISRYLKILFKGRSAAKAFLLQVPSDTLVVLLKAKRKWAAKYQVHSFMGDDRGH